MINPIHSIWICTLCDSPVPEATDHHSVSSYIPQPLPDLNCNQCAAPSELFALESKVGQTGEQILNKLFQLSNEAIFMLDHDGCIQQVNLQAEKVFEMSRSEMIGEQLSFLLPLFDYFEPGSNPYNMTCLVKRKSGYESIMKVELKLLESAQHIVVVVRESSADINSKREKAA